MSQAAKLAKFWRRVGCGVVGYVIICHPYFPIFVLNTKTMPHISKSSYIRGLQCHKSLFLHLNQPELKDGIGQAQQFVFDTGHNIGQLAQQLFPGGIDASRGNPQEVRQALAYTRELIEAGQKVIYEGAFAYDDTLCYIDILVNTNGQWKAYEVKASTKLKDYHYNDIAFQYNTICNAGLQLTEINLVHLNKSYVRRGELDVQQLFTIVNLTDYARDEQAELTAKILDMKHILSLPDVPAIPTGNHCTSPFTCDFYGHCHKDVKPDIFHSTKGIKAHKIEKLREHNVTNMADIPPSLAFSAREWVVLKGLLNDEIQNNKVALKAFVSKLRYPLYFFDFETIMPAIPLYDESHPYQQIPFQYSLHILNEPDAELTHKEHLGIPPDDPRPALIYNLIDQLGEEGDIIVYYAPFEKSILQHLANDFPQYKSQMENFLSRLVDLIVPFRRQYLYLPAMKGSYSIKAVLPALVDDVSYSDLEIQEGGTASITYQNLYTDTDLASIAQKRKNLIEYCTLDTLAMVKLLQQIS